MESKLELSHVLYRVQDLHQAVKKLKDAGFIVQYGTKPEKAYNALLWFEHGVFIELYQNSGLPAPLKWFMKTFGYQPVLDRINKWEQIENGWCEWSLESLNVNLDIEKKILKKHHIPFKFHKAKRKDIFQQVLRWELVMPNDIMFPFIMSSYVPSPRPKKIAHPNGVKSVSKLIIGNDNFNMELLDKLLPSTNGLSFVNGEGLKKVLLSNSDISIEEILK